MILRRGAAGVLFLAGIAAGAVTAGDLAGASRATMCTPDRALRAAPAPIAAPSAQQPTLEVVSRRFASLWAAGDAGGVEALMSTSGVRLNLDRSGHAALGARQATAALRAFHEDYAPGSAAVHRLSNAEGDPPRGFAEVGWQTRTRAGEDVSYSLFVVFLQEEGSWRVSEIRVLR